MRSIVLALPVLLVAACHTGPSLGPSPFRVSYGDFHFIEHPQGSQNPLEGSISVTADEIQVDTKDIGCFPVVTNDPKLQAFRCGEFSIRAQKIAESWEFYYGTQREVEQRYIVCDAYTTLDNGSRVCSASHEEVRTRKIPVNGRIRLYAEAMAGIGGTP